MAGIDTMLGGDGNDTYHVDVAGDVTTETNALADGGIDIVNSAVTRTLGANLENLTLTGGQAIVGIGNTLANVLTGNGAANTLSGGNGNDTLIGGLGRDILQGGLNNDVFKFNAFAETGTASTTRDLIQDFTKGQDKISLSVIDANTGTATNDAFGLLAKGTATSAVGTGKIGYFWEGAGATAKTIIRGNVDADTTIEFTIELRTHITLAATDFVL